MKRNVFEIQGLECAYDRRGSNGKNVVLRIERLDVPMGKVSVILGPSGSGKSTLVETLGLMNNTINSGSVRYTHDGGCITIDQSMWKRQEELTRIRNRHFSFIFQNDFLMPHYSPEENMMMGSLIHGEENSMQPEDADLNELCRLMGLDFEEIKLKHTSELSVGQKQRLSFIRAMVKKYSVIFGDEPTGNLDERNSAMVLDVLKTSIGKNPGQSAILVSHNITLSIAKADFIILLSPVDETYEVLPGNVFSRTSSGWENVRGSVLSDNDLTRTIRDVINVCQPVC
jgi:lipoprotein-releasing system ATP-binding protein